MKNLCEELKQYNDNTKYVKILSDDQAKFYMLHDCIPVKVYFSEYDDSKNRIVYVFDKNESYHAYKLWKLGRKWNNE